MKRAGNYSIITSPDGAVEQDSYTCYHCQKIMLVKPRQKPDDLGGICKICMQLICPECVGKGTCDPFEKKLERVEARDKFLRQAGLS
jgi:hypothetical protein